MSADDIRNIRLQKLARLSEVFGTAFPINVEQSHTLEEVTTDFTKLSTKRGGVKIVGRIKGLRGHGGSTFLDVEEGSAQMQVYIKKNEIGKEMYDTFIEGADIGDIFSFTGTLFITKKKEKTLLAKKFRPLAKGIRQLPEKWHGIQDTEERFRQRALDLLMNPEAQERFRIRRVATRAMREFLQDNKFEEVETPILQPLYGGAMALPFTTHYNALDQDFYLRIAPELYLKRLIVGNIPRVFEIGKSFRNEGIDVTHSPEFTSMEGYMSYADLADLQKLLEAMMIKIVKSVHKKGEFEYDGKKVKVKKGFRTLKFMDAIKRYALINHVEKMSDEELRASAKEIGISLAKGISKGKILDEIFKKAVRKHLVEPTFITHHPLDISPLAKASEEVPGSAERVQLIIAGLELMNAYVELNDPLEQRARFEAQEKMLKKGDGEAARLDEDYLETMEYGMPPVAGFGVGIDRLIQLLTDTHNIRDVILFPALRQKNDE